MHRMCLVCEEMSYRIPLSLFPKAHLDCLEVDTALIFEYLLYHLIYTQFILI